MIQIGAVVKFALAVASHADDLMKAGRTAKEVLEVLKMGNESVKRMVAEKRGPTKAERDLLNASVKLHSERLG